MAAPVGNTCPDIDAIILTIDAAYKILDTVSSDKSIEDNLSYVSDAMNEIYDLTKFGRRNPLEDLRSANSALRDWGNEKEEEISAMDDKISTLEAEIESFEYQLQESKDLNQRLQNEVSEADEQLRLKDSEINELKGTLINVHEIMRKGLEFTMKDGSKDWYDPIDIENDYKETPLNYLFELSNGAKYAVDKRLVESVRQYDLCKSCGYEIKEGQCENFFCPLHTDL